MEIFYGLLKHFFIKPQDSNLVKEEQGGWIGKMVSKITIDQVTRFEGIVTKLGLVGCYTDFFY